MIGSNYVKSNKCVISCTKIAESGINELFYNQAYDFAFKTRIRYKKNRFTWDPYSTFIANVMHLDIQTRYVDPTKKSSSISLHTQLYSMNHTAKNK